MGFKASEQFEPLDWDFRPYLDASGTTPEPSDKQLDEFTKARKVVVDKVRGPIEKEADSVRAEIAARREKDGDNADARDLLDRLDAIDWRAVNREITNLLVPVVAKVTSDQPSAEQMMQLPPPVREAYIIDVTSKVLDPESRAVATSNSSSATADASTPTT